MHHPPERRAPRRIYRGEALRAVAMPLGGLGTGSIALAGDGSLRQWQIHNQVNHLACLPGSFFAVWAKQPRSAEPPVARVLQSAALYHTPAPPVPPTANDHLVPPAHEELLDRLPGVAVTDFVGEYPIAEITYHDPALPIEVSLEAFSPFVPLDAAESGLPAIVFNFDVHNPTGGPIQAALAATLQNAVGWDGAAPVFETRSFQYGGNTNAVVRYRDLTVVNMTSTGLSETDERWGSMALAAFEPAATCLAQWDDLAELWADFSTGGRLSGAAGGAFSAAGRTWNGALAVKFTLAPMERRTVTFLLAWHFPNRYVNYSQGWLLGIDDRRSRFWIGNEYAARYRSALDVVDHVAAGRERLFDATRLARAVLHDSTLPAPLIEAVTSQISVLRSPTCFRAEDGRFYGFEGCCGASTPGSGAVGGCCPLNCTHVWNYEMALARLFPALERTMRDTEWDLQQHPTGYLPHRVPLPSYLPRPWERKIGGPERPALDGLLGAVLKTYREYRASGDTAWLVRAWPAVKRALDHIWTAHDPGREGIIAGEQPNTYDISIYGVNSFIGTLYLAALRSIQEMAAVIGAAGADESAPALAAECARVFEHGRAEIERRLWNGEYYIQDVDLGQHPEQNWGGGCFSDQLLGQWWAHFLGLGHLLDPEHVRSAARAIVRHNFRRDFHDHLQQPRVYAGRDDQGLLNCTWPNGGRPAVPTLYSDEVWTGIEYEVAGLLIYEGETDLALQIVAAVRDRHDGTAQNPWNDVECGDHYVRALASWSLLEAACGYSYDAGRGEMRFAPAFTPEDFRAPFVARDGWGVFSQRITAGEQVARVWLTYGSLELTTLSVAARGTVRSARLEQEGRTAEASWAVQDGDVVFRLLEPMRFSAGQALTANLSQDA